MFTQGMHPGKMVKKRFAIIAAKPLSIDGVIQLEKMLLKIAGAPIAG